MTESMSQKARVRHTAILTDRQTDIETDRETKLKNLRCQQ